MGRNVKLAVLATKISNPQSVRAFSLLYTCSEWDIQPLKSLVVVFNEDNLLSLKPVTTVILFYYV